MTVDWLVVLVRAAGVVMLLLVPLNLIDVPRRFEWKREMAGLSLLNRQIFWVHSWFICLILAQCGLLALLLTRQLLEPTPLARAIDGGVAFFWLLRLVMQWFVYSPSIWRGNRFYTVVHYTFTATWLLLFVTFTLAWLRASGR